MTTIVQEFEFHEVVAKVEERFRPVLDEGAKAKLGAMEGSGGGSEGKYEPEMVSTGWWVVLARFGIAVRFGTKKPDVEPGDTLVLTARKIPKAKPAPPVAAVVPDTPKPPSFTPAELEAILELAESAGSDAEGDCRKTEGAGVSTYEDDILARHSTPGLRKNQFNRAAHREALAGKKVSREEIEKILNDVHPPELNDVK